LEEQIYKLKIAALLHDPPDKPFEIGRHTERAKNLAEDILGSEISNLIDNDQIKLADKIASSFDRWILSILMGGDSRIL
jgi:CRISPR/Cas system-associated protein Cas10 (large subunit of type III CRISPR-Cas system)